MAVALDEEQTQPRVTRDEAADDIKPYSSGLLAEMADELWDTGLFREL